MEVHEAPQEQPDVATPAAPVDPKEEVTDTPTVDLIPAQPTAPQKPKEPSTTPVGTIVATVFIMVLLSALAVGVYLNS
jgi:hypothetical protein